MKERTENKHVLIIGGSGGLGSKIASIFNDSGWKTSVLTRKNDLNGDFFLNIQADLKDSSQIQTAIKMFQKRLSKLHAVIFAAGVVQDQLLLKVTESQWDEVEWVNLKSVWALMQGLVPLIKLAGGGHLVHVGSVVGVTGRRGQSNYAAAKAGLIALSKSAAQELGSDNIRCNVILPGFLRTKMTAPLSKTQIEKIQQQNVLGRTGTIEEVARFVYFVCSTEHISGQVFNLDSRILPTY